MRVASQGQTARVSLMRAGLMRRLALVRTGLPTELLAGEWGAPPASATLRLDVPDQPSLEACLLL